VRERAKPSGIDPDTCATCGSVLIEGERTPGTYKSDGVTHRCHCEVQIMLRKHYLLANIPDQYMVLNWHKDFVGSSDAKEAVDMFLDKWPAFKRNGMGMEFTSADVGVGKTFAAVTLAKELVKAREKVLFIEFREMLTSLSGEGRGSFTESEVRDTNVIVLDEIVAPYSEKQQRFFADRFEAIIRHRTNYNAVTILTTNLTQTEIEEHYPKTYSLLSAKSLRVEMNGEDARQSHVQRRNLELILNDETRPIV
jgi:hypothetical protein